MGGEKQAVSVKNNCRLKREQDAIDIFLKKEHRMAARDYRDAAGGRRRARQVLGGTGAGGKKGRRPQRNRCGPRPFIEIGDRLF